MKNSIILLSLLFISSFSNAQKVEDIISKYYETIGGKNWDAVNGMRMTANVEANGMKIPVEVVMMKDGKMYTKTMVNHFL